MTAPKRPRDPNQLAKFIVDAATGEDKEREPAPETEGKSAVAVNRGRAGGAARAASVSPERRAEIARKAAESRWKR